MDVFEMLKELKNGREGVDEAVLAVGRLQANRFDVFAALKALKKQHAGVVEAITILERLALRRSHNIKNAGKGLTGRRGRTWTAAQRKEQSQRVKNRAAARREAAKAPSA